MISITITRSIGHAMYYDIRRMLRGAPRRPHRRPPAIACALALLAASALGAAPPQDPQPPRDRPDRPSVAILVYDGVQVIDHAIPYEVFGQFSLNDVYTVAARPGPVTTFMGMRVLPNHTFEDAPPPDVLVFPGGDTREARRDPEIVDWVRRQARDAEHVLTICTGIFFLLGTDLLEGGARVTTWYDRQDDLRRAAPEAVVVGDRVTVESGRLVSAAGTGIEGSLRMLARLHGEAWAEVVRLNMEHQPVPDSLRIPRVALADLNLPDAIYGTFPWRRATLEEFEGDRDRWTMTWRFEPDGSLDSLGAAIARAVGKADEWTLAEEARSAAGWSSRWAVEGRDGRPWAGAIELAADEARVRLTVRVRREAEDGRTTPCESVDPAWSPDGRALAFASNCGAASLEIHRMNPDGADRVRLTRTPGDEHGPAFSPDGSRIAYGYRLDGEDSEIWIMDADGRDARPVTENESTDWSPSWSPDGRRLAIERVRDGNADIWVVNVETGAETRLTDHPARDVSPRWSPDGSVIAFQSDRGGRYAIYVVSPDGGAERRIVDLPGNAVTPAWSPDSKRIALTHHANGAEIVIAAVDGGEPVHLAADGKVVFAPAWSPDGSRIAFMARAASEAWALWIMEADGSNPRRLTGNDPDR